MLTLFISVFFSMPLKGEANEPVNSKTANAPTLPGANHGAFDLFKNFGQIFRYIASLDGQMPHPLEL